MRNLRLHPEVADRPCATCRKWLHAEDGRIDTAKDFVDGQDVEVPKRRANPDDVPCNTAKGCPRGHFNNPIELSDQLRQAYEFYLTCKAVGSFPVDPLVYSHAKVIRQAEDYCDRHERMRELEIMFLGSQASVM